MKSTKFAFANFEKGQGRMSNIREIIGYFPRRIQKGLDEILSNVTMQDGMILLEEIRVRLRKTNYFKIHKSRTNYRKPYSITRRNFRNLAINL